MDVEIIIDQSAADTRIIIYTPAMTDEIADLAEMLSRKDVPLLCGIKDDKLEIINPSETIRIYAENKKVYAQTDIGIFLIKQRLYQLEDILDKRKFVRISNSEIINLDKVSHFDLNYVGTICVKLKDGTITYVSRRYVSELKRILGL